MTNRPRWYIRPDYSSITHKGIEFYVSHPRGKPNAFHMYYPSKDLIKNTNPLQISLHFIKNRPEIRSYQGKTQTELKPRHIEEFYENFSKLLRSHNSIEGSSITGEFNTLLNAALKHIPHPELNKIKKTLEKKTHKQKYLDQLNKKVL